MDWKNIVAVGIGGAIGTAFRYLINLHFSTFGSWQATLIENVFGSFFLGFLTGLFMHRLIPGWLKVGLTAGFCGSFTTMSALAADSIFLTANIAVLYGLIYIVFSVIGGLTAAFFGYWLGLAAGKKDFS